MKEIEKEDELIDPADFVEAVQEEFEFRNPWKDRFPRKSLVADFKRGMEIIVPKSVLTCGTKTVVADHEAGTWRILFPLKCNNWVCDKCRKRLSKKWIKRINPTEVERFITLTVDPKRFTDPGAAVKKIYEGYKKLIQAIRRRDKKFEYFSVIEFTKRGWPHMHILQRGSYIEKKWLSEKWSAFGLGQIVDIQQIWGGENVKHYLTKYLSKEGQAFFFHLRKIRFSRGFFLPEPERPKWLREFTFRVSGLNVKAELAISPTWWKLQWKEGDMAFLKYDEGPE